MENHYLKGASDASPIMLGYIPIGLAFGILAAQQGLSVFDIFFMSLFVYAGSAQFIAVSMISSGAAATSIIISTFLVNLRHFLMSASLSPYLKHISSPVQSLISFGITDETFAVEISRSRSEVLSAKYYASLHIASQICWILSTTIGGMLGTLIPNPERWGIDFALTAMFIGLLLAQLKMKKDIIVAVCAGLISLILAIKIDGTWNIIIATVLAATIGVSIDIWIKNSSLFLSE